MRRRDFLCPGTAGGSANSCRATLAALAAYIDTLDDAADIAWTPRVTRGVRLISIVQDAQAYIGQVSYAAGASDASAWRMRRRLAAVHALH